MSDGEIHHQRAVSVPLAETHIPWNAPVGEGHLQSGGYPCQLCQLKECPLENGVAVLQLVSCTTHHMIS